jgi:hypothetical protein
MNIHEPDMDLRATLRVENDAGEPPEKAAAARIGCPTFQNNLNAIIGRVLSGGG